ncbi:hypothetical protein OU426_05150 [Frigidibacter sp. RF13]|uniref:hypothetical protein n=1 Tax=Frigidibacter sp. RF13 TaxID=2997340 RepID=UPI00226E1E9B|nr:hypothetical protein [Frigidibacter sp. RF13]MCY1126235.1 hypothetical protein [Frigidibacter sp. RF13]
MRRVLAGTVIAVCLASTANASSWLETGREGLELCAENLKDKRAVQTAMDQAGWRYEGSEGTVKGYSKDGRRIIVIHGEWHPRKLACGIMVRKMTPDQAIEMAKAFLPNIADAKSSKRSKPDSIAEWTGRFQGVAVRLAATREGNIGINHGAAVVLTEE